MRHAARLVTLSLLLAPWGTSPALAESAGAPPNPPAWNFAPSDDPTPVSHEGVFVLQASFQSWDDFYDIDPTFSITVEDVEGVAVPGEATYLEIGRWGDAGPLVWRATTPFGAPGDTLTAHVELHNHPDSWMEDTITDVSLVMVDDPTPATQPPVIVSHEPLEMFEPNGYSCVLSRASVIWEGPALTEDWMTAFTVYRSERSVGGIQETWTHLAPAEVVQIAAITTLADDYCVRLVTMNLANDTEAAVESCLDNQAFIDALTEGQTLCTLDNYASHESEEWSPASDRGGCHTTGASAPWLLALLALLAIAGRGAPCGAARWRRRSRAGFGRWSR